MASSHTPTGGGSNSLAPPQHPHPTPVQSSNDNMALQASLVKLEHDTLQNYRPPGSSFGSIKSNSPTRSNNNNFHGMESIPPQPKPIQYVHNPLDGSLLKDQKGQPVSVARMLATKPLRNEISTRKGPGGRMIPYMSGDTVTRILNDVFGYDGWNLDIIKVNKEEIKHDSKTGRFTAVYTAQVRITERSSGAYREECGCDETIDKHFGTAVSNAMKSAVTDAMKRAARQFGDKAGNSLYEQGKNHNSAPTTLQQALDAYDINQANTKFGFKNKGKAAPPPPPPQAKKSTAPLSAKPGVGVHHQSNNNKSMKPTNTHTHQQKQNTTTHSAPKETPKAPPPPPLPPSRPSGQNQVMPYSSTTTSNSVAAAPIARPTSSYRSNNNTTTNNNSNGNNHFTGKPPIPAATTTVTVGAPCGTDPGRRVSLDQHAGSGSGGHGNPYNQGQSGHSNTAPSGSTTMIPSSQPPPAPSHTMQSTSIRPPLHSLPVNDTVAAAYAAVSQMAATQQQQTQPAKRPATQMTNPYSQHNSYPNKHGGGRNSF